MTNKITLIRKPKRPKINTYSIKKGEYIAEGGFGKVYNINLKITTSKGKEKIRITKSFNSASELIELNRRDKLGLRIVDSLRLKLEKGKMPSFIMKKYDIIELKGNQILDYYYDSIRQKKLLHDIGYECGWDIFFPILDKKTGKAVAIIGDFDNIEKLNNKTKR